MWAVRLVGTSSQTELVGSENMFLLHSEPQLGMPHMPGSWPWEAGTMIISILNPRT